MHSSSNIRIHLRSFLMSFTSAFLCFITVWMAALMFIHPATSSLSSAVPQESASVYLPDNSDCMTLLMCEETATPQVFLLLRFQPVSGSIFIFAFPNRLVLTHSQVSEPVEKIYQSGGIQAVRQALAESYSIKADHYLRAARDSLPTLLDAFGPIPITLDKDFSTVINDIAITMNKGLQLLDGQRLFDWIRHEAPNQDIERCAFFSQTLAFCINQHLDWLSEDRSEKLFSTIVNHTDTDLIFLDYDARRKAASFLAQICPEPALAFVPQFIRNPDATLSLSEDSLKNLLDAFI